MTKPSIALLLALCAMPVHGQMFKCTAANGRVTYQADACPTAQKAEAVRVRPENTAANRPLTEDAAARLLLMYDGCARQRTEFGARYQALMDEWREKNVHLVKKVENSADFKAKLAKARDQRPAGASPQEVVDPSCVQVLLPALGGSSDPEGGVTPQEVWAAFTAALRRGDSAGAFALLDAPMREKYAPRFSRMNAKEMREMADGIRNFQMVQAGETTAIAAVANAAGDAGSVTFVRSRYTGRWLIATL